MGRCLGLGLRSPGLRDWNGELELRLHDHGFFWGKADRGCEKAGWLHNAYATYAADHGMSAGTLLCDLSKFYDNCRHDTLWAEAQALDFNLVLPALSLE